MFSRILSIIFVMASTVQAAPPIDPSGTGFTTGDLISVVYIAALVIVFGLGWIAGSK